VATESSGVTQRTRRREKVGSEAKRASAALMACRLFSRLPFARERLYLLEANPELS